MRVLHVVKTADGANWAAELAGELTRAGIEIHVALPRAHGKTVDAWHRANAVTHVLDIASILNPWRRSDSVAALHSLLTNVKPDLIHSHFVNTTVALRLALGKHSGTPRIFQVAGPLHLEHRHSRWVELLTAGNADWWIGSSRCIVDHYRKFGVARERLFLSYYGARLTTAPRTGYLRQRLGIPNECKIVGNINLIYPPKFWLGQSVGLKCHEDVIDAIGIVHRTRKDVVGVLIGETFGSTSRTYERKLRERARRVGQGSILMPGYFDREAVEKAWPDFDCAVHVPLSENCGGVVEPLLAGVPTIAARVGGLPEVVIDGVTGRLGRSRNPDATASLVLDFLNDPLRQRELAFRGRDLVRKMFDIHRTATEVLQIYKHILYGERRPPEFLSDAFCSFQFPATA